MSKRNEWEFQYQASDLLEAAEAEYQKREERIGYWRDKREEVLEKLKQEGLEITNWNEGSGVTKASIGSAIDVQFDQKLIGRLRECEQWLERARSEKKEYAMWVQVFSDCQSTQAFQLHGHDVAYFGLGKSVEPDFVAPEDAEHSGSPTLA